MKTIPCPVCTGGKHWQSFSKWPAGTCPGDISSDLHDSEKDAKEVCIMLTRRGFGCDGKVFPLKTWVEKL